MGAEEGRGTKYPTQQEVKSALHSYLILAAAAVALRVAIGLALV